MNALPIIALLVGFFAVEAMAQTTKKSNYPYYTISKEVARLQFKNIEHVPAKITLVSPVLTQSKGSTQLLAKKEELSKERVLVRFGYPAWTISKGVARRQYERSQRR